MIKLKFSKDGVWICAETAVGKHGMVSLNKIVAELKPILVKQAFIEALEEEAKRATGGKDE